MRTARGSTCCRRHLPSLSETWHDRGIMFLWRNRFVAEIAPHKPVVIGSMLDSSLKMSHRDTYICGGAKRDPIATLDSSVPLIVRLDRILLPLAISNLALIVYSFQ